MSSIQFLVALGVFAFSTDSRERESPSRKEEMKREAVEEKRMWKKIESSSYLSKMWQY